MKGRKRRGIALQEAKPALRSASSKSVIPPLGERRILLYLVTFALIFSARLASIGVYGPAHPFWDAWEVEGEQTYKPFLNGTLKPSDLFAPVNEHRPALFKIYNLLLLTWNGQWDARVQMTANAVLFALTGCLLLRYLARCVRRRYDWIAAAVIAVVMALPIAPENLLNGHHSPWYILYLLTVPGLALLATAPVWSLSWLGGAACVVLSYFASMTGAMTCLTALLLSVYRIVERDRVVRNVVLPGLIFAGIAAVELVWQPRFAGQAAHRAVSASAFVIAMSKSIGWPYPSFLAGGFLAHLPALVLGGLQMVRRRSLEPAVLFAIWVWVVGCAVAVAYARGGAGEGPLLRYCEILAFGVIVNAVCLLILVTRFGFLTRRAGIVFTAIWVGGTSLAIGSHLSVMLREWMPRKLTMNRRQEANLRRFVIDRDFGHLRNQPMIETAYYKPEDLPALLGDPALRSILPSTIREPLAMPPAGGANGSASFMPDGFDPALTPSTQESVFGSFGMADGARRSAVFRSGVVAVPRLPYLEYLIAASSTVTGLSLRLAEVPSVQLPSPMQVVSLYPRQEWMLKDAQADAAAGWVRLVAPAPAAISSMARGFQLSKDHDYYATFLARRIGKADTAAYISVELIYVSGGQMQASQEHRIPLTELNGAFRRQIVTLQSGSNAPPDGIIRLHTYSLEPVEISNFLLHARPAGTADLSKFKPSQEVELPSGGSGVWHKVHAPAPSGPFVVIAEDKSGEGWFAFSQAREMGRLSYWCYQLALLSPPFTWLSGLAFVLIVLAARRENG